MKRKSMIMFIGLLLSLSVLTTACGNSGMESKNKVTTEAENDTETTSDQDAEKKGDRKKDGNKEGDKEGKEEGKGKHGESEKGGNKRPEKPEGKNGKGKMGGGADTQNYDYDGTLTGTLSADGEEVTSEGETIKATESDVNAVLVQNGGTLTVTNATLNKSGDDDNGDNCNFYGLNSIALAVGESSKMVLADAKMTADSEGSNAVFATDNAEIYVQHTSINTTAGNSRGLDATYGGTIIADDMTITTNGDHCATTATDRGGGNISVTNSTFETNGSGSPLLYSTGNIQVDHITGTATGSQLAGMEGYNTIMINNSDLTSTITKPSASDPVANGVIIYQSMSGDADTTTGERALFQAVDSKLTSKIEEGAMFYITNTVADVLLSNTALEFDADKANLLAIEGNDSNSWGIAGENGATVNFTALGETLKGDISVDTISSLSLYLLDGSTYTGAMSIKENKVNTNRKESPIIVNLGADSTWTLTADSTISELNAKDLSKIVDESGKTVTIVVDGDVIREGKSDLTLTVTGSYSDQFSTSDVNELNAEYIDRSDFDSYFGTKTTFGSN